MSTAVKLSDAPFHYVEQAINAAYRAEAVAILKTSTFLADLRGGTVRAATLMTAHDRLAQASFTRSLIAKTLPEPMRDLMDAYYTVPEGVTLETRKELAFRTLSHRLWEDMERIPNRWYLCDAAKAWVAPRLREHDEKWWSKKLAVTDRTLRNWRLGTRERDGLEKRLSAMRHDALRRLEDAFYDAGLCG